MRVPMLAAACAAVTAVAVAQTTGALDKPVSTRQTPAHALPAGYCHYGDSGAVPDRRCTPGAVNHAVTQATIAQTICVPGWSTRQRPDSSITRAEKRVSLRAYGYAFGTKLENYQYDHLIPIELGGAPNDLRNMWPEPNHVPLDGGEEGAPTKDEVENKLHRLVCAGSMKLAVARRVMRTDWRLGG